jgi:hypothetical protein
MNQSMPITSSAPLRDPHEPVVPEAPFKEQLAETENADVATTERQDSGASDLGAEREPDHNS